MTQFRSGGRVQLAPRPGGPARRRVAIANRGTGDQADYNTGPKSWGAHAPSRVVCDALVENWVEWSETHVFGEGAKVNTRGTCAPRNGFLQSLFLRSLRSFAAEKAVGKGFLAAKELKEHKDGLRLLGC
jgi:hypothetical protein